MRGRFRQGWGLAWGLVSVGIMIASRSASSDGNTSVTVLADPSRAASLLSDTARIVWLYALCTLGAGVGSYLALTAVTIPDRVRRSSALIWVAIAVLTVAANLYLLDHPGPPWWYEWTTGSVFDGTIRREHFNPWSVHLAITMSTAGALGGLIQGLIVRGAANSLGVGRAVIWMLVWSVAFLATKYVGVVAVYLLTGMVIDAFEKIGDYGAHIGGLIGWFLGGYIAGYVMGAIASFSPGITWLHQDK